jgi:hypothetical protein
MKHQVRYQLLKAGKANSALDQDMTVGRLMRADVKKLGVVQNWVPKLSVELSSAKKALEGLDPSERQNAGTVFEWLEQNPVSAKHYSAAEAEVKLEPQLSGLVSALEHRNPGRLANVVRETVKNDPVSKALLDGNLKIADMSEVAKATGGSALQELEGVNLNQTTELITESLKKHAASGGSRLSELAAGRGAGLRAKEISEVVSSNLLSSSGLAKGFFNDVSKSALAASNKIAAMGEGVVKNYKPLALGFAASLAVAAALSEPIDTIGPGAALIQQGAITNEGKAARGMQQEDLRPPQQSVGRPTAPNMLKSQRALIAPNRSSKYIVNANVPYGTNSQAVAGVVAGSSGVKGSFNINLRDNRQIGNKYVEANRID